MLLSIQQRYILELLKKTGYMRYNQLYILTREYFKRSEMELEISAKRMEIMLHQMKNINVRMDEDVVRLSLSEPNLLRLEAIDIMLELTDGHVLDFKTRLDYPEILKFISEDEHTRPITVAVLPDDSTTAAETVEDYKAKRMVWFSVDGQLPCQLQLPKKHFFAERQKDSSHKFYGCKDTE